MKLGTTTTFPAKILLFGEYTVLRGSQALAMPLHLYVGHWQQSQPFYVHANLLKFNAYLENLVAAGKIDLDTEGFKKAIEAGEFFYSTIPTGYGAGSSGAVTAAVLRRFGKVDLAEITDADLPQLKTILGLMESCFHGSSSGFDPLISFVQQPILIRSDKTMQLLTMPKTDLSIFLIDTQQPRKTEPLVNAFLEKCQQNPEFNALIINELTPSVNDAIQTFLTNQTDLFFDTLHHISHVQYRFFEDLIPSKCKQIWLDGLASSVFKLKLCGAGGGGFILGFAKEKATVERAFSGKFQWIQ
jgi:mevalonate kinase